MPSELSYAVSVIAALEEAVGRSGHAAVLPYLGMARAELVDFGQRRIGAYVDVEVVDVRATMAELDARLTSMLSESEVLQHTLRVEAALRLLRRGMGELR